jgi:hypothetical protein
MNQTRVATFFGSKPEDRRKVKKSRLILLEDAKKLLSTI